MKPKLKISVNKNPTKEGIKVQFVMPSELQGDAKTVMTQKLQSRLNQGLSPLGLTSNIDTDVPYNNIIGFFISIADVKMMIKKAITGVGGEEEQQPSEEV